MKNKTESRSHLNQIFGLVGLLVFVVGLTESKGTTNEKETAEILVKRLTNSTASGETVPKILKVTQNGHEQIVHAAEIVQEPRFTLKSDPVKVQSDFKTVDISVINRERDRENAKKIAVIQEDLQSRIKINEPELRSIESVEVRTEPEPDPIDLDEVIRKQARVKEDIESRLFLEDGFLGYRQQKEHYPMRRSDDDYYAEEPVPDPPQESRMTTEAPKEEDSFFSIFESLFGSSDEDSQTKKKAKPEDDLPFKTPEDESLKENIKTVGDILKPLKPIDEPEIKAQNVPPLYQSDAPEYRIVNNFHANQAHRQGYRPPVPKPNYSYYRPASEKPFRPYKPPSTSGYEDYDLEEFMDKGDTPTTRVKYVSPSLPTSTLSTNPPTKTTTSTTTTTTTTTTTAKTTTKNIYDNKLKFPSVQKKNDYINRNRYQEVKTEATETRTERVTERTTQQKPEIKTTTENRFYNRPNEYYETKVNEVKPHKIQESPNFYNLINLPVRYSTKDTAIPLISTSYANTKIQGMGASKYEKGANGKYPNHKYDQVSTSTTKRPNYWATKRTSTEGTHSSFRPSPMIPSKITTKYPSTDLDKIEMDEHAVGLGPEFGGYGSKTGVETKIPTRPPTTTTLYKESTTKRNDEVKLEAEESQNRPHSEQNKPKIKEPEAMPEKTSEKPDKSVYEDYDYYGYPAHVQEIKPSSPTQNYPPGVNYSTKDQYYQQQQNQLDSKKQHQSSQQPSESSKPSEVIEYEYYDYDVDLSTTTTTTTTAPKYKIKYPSFPKDKIKTSTSEKVAVVVPSKDHDFYNENHVSSTEYNKPVTTISTTSGTTVPTTTTTTTTSTTTTTTTTPETSPTTVQTTQTKTTEPQTTTQFKKPTTQYYKPNQFYKEPAPVFEEVEEPDEYTTKQHAVFTTKKVTADKSTPTTTTEATVKPVIVTSSSKEQESNVNIVLVPTKETVKSEPEQKYSQPEPPAIGSGHRPHVRPIGPQQTKYDYTTEFTVGVVHGHGGNPPLQGHGLVPSVQGHFVASSISANPYGDDEPFRPIPKPAGLAPNYQITKEETRQPPKKPVTFQNKRPTHEESDPAHEPHEFIPSPQFHRPVEPKPGSEGKPGSSDIDYDFEGIQTEPKPGQYVIFSKPQLNPEMNENQLKKKPEISTPQKGVSNVPQYHDKVHPFGQDGQKHVTFKEGQFYQNQGKPKPPASDKIEVGGRPVYGPGSEITDDRLSLQLVPPRGTQTEKPFEGNFVVPEVEKQDSTINYPRPHWEKNGKPSFLMNKNDMHGTRFPPMPPQMAPTLIPPSSVPPQRFRRPLQPHMPPIRKNFNEAGTNVKPKPNLPNILPQFRPNAKVGSGPYHRPPGYISSNRRNGMNRYHEKEHGNFPYHIQHPDKDGFMHREYEMAPEIVPKFITNRGKLLVESWNSQGMQKRFGQGLMNVNSRTEPYLNPGPPPQNPKVLRRAQRTPVTTLQMLKQMPGMKTQKTQVSREDNADPSAPLVPPFYKNYVDQSKTEENVYIVYPAKAPQKIHSDDTKVFIVSDTKSQKNSFNFTKQEGQHPLLNPNKKPNVVVPEKQRNDFPYGFIKPDERLKLIRKQQKESEENGKKNVKADDPKEEETKPSEYKVLPVTTSSVKDEKIDMNLHMQSNNQWNEVRTVPDSMSSVRNPTENRNDHYRFSEHGTGSEVQQSEQQDKLGIRNHPPSEYHTSIKNENNSAFTLGAVMHTVSEANRRGQVASVSLHNSDEEVNLPKLNVNERISNGKIITVSMPLNVQHDTSEERDSERYQFQAPFQASSSISSSESHPTNQGWSIVKNPDDKSDTEDGKETTETSASTQFNFENFKPELIGGFKPIYELPDEPEEIKEQEKVTDREEKELGTR